MHREEYHVKYISTSILSTDFAAIVTRIDTTADQQRRGTQQRLPFEM